VSVPSGLLEFDPLTPSAEPAVPVYGPPALAVGAVVIVADGVSPDALYALTTTVCAPPENGSATEHPHAPVESAGASP